MSYKVDLAVACAQSQFSDWTGNLIGALLQEQQRGIEFGQIMLVSSAMPDFNKNNTVGGKANDIFGDPSQKWRNERTDANRVAASSYFLSGDPSLGKSDWLFWVDDDTVIPSDALSRLLALDKPACAGLYFNPNPPKNPIAYVRNTEGIGYRPLYDYPYGALMQVDSVGMGCTLVHRSVFESIMQEHVLYQRPNASLWPVHKSKIYNANDPFLNKQPDVVNEIVINGWMCQRVTKPVEDDNRAWPFFVMEHGRTEDHYFWELASACGIRPWVDTTIVCGHIKPRAMTYDDYREYVNREKTSVS